MASSPVGFARPKGATPFRSSLVAAYQPCTSANGVHGPPLAHPSCNPPAQESGTLTIGSPDANGSVANSTGALRLDVNAGDPSTPTVDEADVGVSISLTDVRCAGTSAACPSGQGSDYAGRLLARAGLRITDRYNGPGQDENGTVVETDLEMPFACSVTAGTGVGATCAL